MRKVIFKKLVITNFKKHESLEFEFSDKFVLLVGKNGAGKTSAIPDPICWCLYDQTVKGRTGDSILRKRYPKDCSVILYFDIIDHKETVSYTIENYRKHKVFKNEKILKINGVNQSDISKDKINERIIQLLVPFNVFVNTLLFSQFISKPFTEMTNSQQKEVLDKILNLELYDSYREKFKNAEKETTNIISQKKIILDGNIINQSNLQDLLETEKGESESKSALYKKRIDVLNKDIRDNKSLLDDIKKKLKDDDISLKKELEDNLKSKENEILNEISNLKEKLILTMDSIKSKYQQKFELSFRDIGIKFQEDISKIILQKSALEKESDDLNKLEDAEVQKIQNEILKKTQEISNKYDLPIQEIVSNKDRTLAEKNSLVQKIREMKDLITKTTVQIESYQKQLESDSPACPVCKQNISKNNESFKNVEDHLKYLKDIRKQNEEEIGDLKDKTKSLSDTLDTLREEEESLRIDRTSEGKLVSENGKEKINNVELSYKSKNIELSDKLADIESSLDTIEHQKNTEMVDMKTKVEQDAEKESQLAREKTGDKLKKLEKNRIEARANIISVQQIIMFLENKATEYTKCSHDIENLEQNLYEVLDQDNNSHNFYLKKSQDLMAKIQKEKLEQEKIEDSILKMDRGLDVIKFWKKAFSDQGIKAILLDESIPILNHKAIELSKLTDNIRLQFDSQATIQSGEQRNRFTVNVIQTDELTDDRRDFSGGEGKLVDIITLFCLRYLIEKIHDISFNILILDEVLEQLDQDNVDVATNMIRKMKEDKCVVLISHTHRESLEVDEVVHL